jgi:apolipoprotein N-acyltransferase
LRAVDNPSAPGFQAALAASQQLPPGLQLVVWPEDGVKVEGEVEASSRGQAVADLARRLGATVVSGVSQRQGERFRNQAVAWGPDGAVVDRYQKNQRVPFGEYVPARSLLAEVVDLRAVPRDAVAGTGTGLLSTPAGDLGVMISYEVFFPRRARAAVSAGAEVLLVPTNASSFPSTQMPALELGAARLRAIETGRSLVQAAPTGFSAIIGPDGSVRSQSDLGEPAVLRGTVERRTGSTPYARWGDGPVLALAALALAATWIRVGRSPGTHRQRPGRPFLLDEGP